MLGSGMMGWISGNFRCLLILVLEGDAWRKR